MIALLVIVGACACLAADPLVGYIQLPNTGYYALFAPATWSAAWQQCKDDGGYLLAMDSVEGFGIALAMFGPVPLFEKPFVGFHDMFKAGEYVTIKGEILDNVHNRTHWAPGQPSGLPEERCGAVTANETLDDVDCNQPLAFICEKPWREGYTLARGLGYYKFVTDSPLTWADARDYCIREDAHLLILNSVEEATFVATLWSQLGAPLPGDSPSVALAGIHDLYAPGVVVTVFDTPLYDTGYISLAGPRRYDGNHCGAIDPNGVYILVSCEGTYSFVCEIPLE